MASPTSSGEVGLGVAVSPTSGDVVTARRAGGLRDMALPIDPDRVTADRTRAQGRDSA